MSICPFQDRLKAFLDEQLSAIDADTMEQHLLGCVSCRQHLEQLTSDAVLPRWRELRQGRDLPASELDFLQGVAKQALSKNAKTISWNSPSARADATVQVGSYSSPSQPVLNEPHGQLSPLPVVPGYEILAELGRGGMGVVYEARQAGLNRLVALKMILAGVCAGPREFALFRAEAEAVAALEHPNIVRIYAVGDYAGLPFLCLEYLPGGTLAQRLASGPQPVRLAMELAETISRAVAFAHQHGIIHRDLKPANVLLAADGTPKVSDFGLAKRLAAGQSAISASAVVGTPSYMAPEQVLGSQRTVGPAVDVYAVGAILYEMLTGRPPFRGENPFETLLQVSHTDPVPPRQLRPQVARDLDTICLKCLAKDPRHRYASALALADDLRRCRLGEPIAARPVGLLGRTAKWIRRRPVVAGLLAAIMLLTTIGFLLVTMLWSQAAAKAREEYQARLAMERLSAGVWLDRAEGLCEKGDVAEGLVAFANALELAESAGEADLERVARSNLAAWPARLIRQRAFFGHNSWVYAIAFSPDGQRIATAGDDGRVKIWDAATGRALQPELVHTFPVWSIAFSPDGRTLLSGGGSMDDNVGEACLWDLKTGTVRHRLPHPAGVSAVAFDLDGEGFLTSCPQEAQVWTAASAERRGTPLRHEKKLVSALFSPDGKMVLTGGEDHTGRLWNALTGQPLLSPLVHEGEGTVAALAFLPDGSAVLTGGEDGLARLWATATGKPLNIMLPQRGPLKRAAFSHDGRLLAVGGALEERGPKEGERHKVGGEVKLWAWKEKHLLATLPHPAPVWSLAFSRDDRFLLTGCQDGRARYYDAASGALLSKPLAHEGTVVKVAFSPVDVDPTALTASAGGDKYAAARLWELPRAHLPDQALKPEQAIMSLVCHPQRPELILAGTRNPAVLSCDLTTGALAPILFAHAGGIEALALSRDGRLLLTGGSDDEARLWDLPGRRLLHICPHPGKVTVVAFSPWDDTFWTGSDKGTLRRWQVATGQPIEPSLSSMGRLVTLRAVRNDTITWIESDDRAVRLCQWPSSATGVRVWEQPGRVEAAEISADGRRVLTAAWNARAHVREAATGEPLGPALSHGANRIRGMAFSPDGRSLLTCGWDKTARLWDAATGKPLGPPWPHAAIVFTAIFSLDGRQVLTGGDVNVAHRWELPVPVSGRANEVRLWIEALTGLALDAQGNFRELDAAAVQSRRQQQGLTP